VRPKSGLSNKDAGKLLRVKERVVAAVLDPGAVVDAHDVGVRDAGERKAGEGQEPEMDKKDPLSWETSRIRETRISRSLLSLEWGHDCKGCYVLRHRFLTEDPWSPKAP
jgi:hypothetical protein